jgi:hypothetical protein
VLKGEFSWRQLLVFDADCVQKWAMFVHLAHAKAAVVTEAANQILADLTNSSIAAVAHSAWNGKCFHLSVDDDWILFIKANEVAPIDFIVEFLPFVWQTMS